MFKNILIDVIKCIKNFFKEDEIMRYTVYYASVIYPVSIIMSKNHGLKIWLNYEIAIGLGLWYSILNFWSFNEVGNIKNVENKIITLKLKGFYQEELNDEIKKLNYKLKKYKDKLNKLNSMIYLLQGFIALLLAFIYFL
ncbi:MAG TPA: hypothetical protein PKD16_16220 [Saprospiraceae bacterium]|nr:hypothetical protein [Saprospiraceae bacterium]HMT71716.1 hypothetical protein [Saprospiraceae bacterium]